MKIPFLLSAALVIICSSTTTSPTPSPASSSSLSSNQLEHFTKQRSKLYQLQEPLYQKQFHSFQEYYQSAPPPVVQLSHHHTETPHLSPIINDQHSLIMCTIPKVGSSTWRKFMLNLQFPSLATADGKREYSQHYGVTSPSPHNISQNGVKLMAQQSPSVALEYYNNPKFLKLFHIRNPITRVLSAWLSKNSLSNNPLPFAMYSPTFEIFIQVNHLPPLRSL